MSARCRAIALASSTKAGMRQRLAQASHAWSSTVARTPLRVNTSPGFFFQQVGAVEAVVDLGDSGELGPLAGGQVARVLPQRIAGTFELARQGSLPVLAGRVPHLAAHLVQRVGGPLDDVEWVQAEPCLGAALGHHGRDPGGGVGADQPELLAALLAEGVEEAAKRGRVMAGGGPHQPPGVVVDHHRQVPVALLVRHLIDADPPQPGQAVPASLGIGDDAGDDPPHRRPGHPQQLTDRLLGGVDRQPGGGVAEGAGVAGPMARPGHGGHHHPVLGAADPGRLGLHERLDHPEVQRPPAPPALALVEAGAAPATPTAAAPDSLAGPHRHHQRLLILVQADPFDDRLLDTEQPGP